MRSTADEIVYGDDESEVVWLDGRRCVGDCGEACAQRSIDGVEVCDMFCVDPAFTEIVFSGKGGFGCRQDDAWHLAVCILADGVCKVKSAAKARRHNAVGCEGVDDKDVVPFAARGHDVRKEGIEDEAAEGEDEVGRYHQKKVQKCVPYADEEGTADRIVKERDEHPSKEACSDIEHGDLARSFFIVQLFGGDKTYDREHDARKREQEEQITEEIGICPTASAEPFQTADDSSARKEKQSDVGGAPFFLADRQYERDDADDGDDDESHECASF